MEIDQKLEQRSNIKFIVKLGKNDPEVVMVRVLSVFCFEFYRVLPCSYTLGLFLVPSLVWEI